MSLSTLKNRSYCLNVLLLVVIFLGINVVSISAQQSNAPGIKLEVGNKVKLQAPTVQFGNIIGEVVVLSPSVIGVAIKDSMLYIPLVSVRQLWVSRSKKNPQIVRKGVLTGAALGGVVSLISNNTNSAQQKLIRFSNPTVFAAGAVLGGLVGGLTGVILGSMVRTDDWHRVPLQISFDVQQSVKLLEKKNPVISVQWSF